MVPVPNVSQVPNVPPIDCGTAQLFFDMCGLWVILYILKVAPLYSEVVWLVGRMVPYSVHSVQSWQGLETGNCCDTDLDRSSRACRAGPGELIIICHEKVLLWSEEWRKEEGGWLTVLCLYYPSGADPCLYFQLFVSELYSDPCSLLCKITV